MSSISRQAWLILLFLAAFLQISAASAASQMFLSLGAIQGEVVDSTHNGEIEVLSWSWGGSMVVSSIPGGPPAAGKVSLEALTFTKPVDKSSPAILGCLAKGTHIDNALLTVRKVSPDRTEFYLMRLQNVLITSVAMGGSGGEDFFTETVTLQFQAIATTYTASPAGAPGSGSFSWDIAKNAPGNLSPPQPVTSPPPAPFNAGFSRSNSSQAATLSWSALSGKQYEVLRTDSIGQPFTLYGTYGASQDGTMSIEIPTGAGNGFFQVRIAQ